MLRSTRVRSPVENRWSFGNRLLFAFGWILAWDLFGQPAVTWVWRGCPQWVNYVMACLPPLLIVFGSTLAKRVRRNAS